MSTQPAESAGLSLRWEAPAECDDADAVRAAFAQHVEQDPQAVDAVGRVRVEADGYRLALEVTTREGTTSRLVRAPSCDALAESAGLLLAVAAERVDADPSSPAIPEPETQPPASEPEQTPEPKPEPTPAPPEREPVAVAPQPAPEPEPAALPVRFGLRVDGVVQAFRLLPRVVGGGVAGAFSVLGRRWRAELRGQYFAPQPRDYPDLAVGGRFDLWTVGAAGCWQPGGATVSVPLCAGAELGGLRGQATAVDLPGESTALFAGGTLDVALLYAPTSWLALRLGVGGVVSAARPRFHVRGQNTVFRGGPGALRASAGVEFHVPRNRPRQ